MIAEKGEWYNRPSFTAALKKPFSGGSYQWAHQRLMLVIEKHMYVQSWMRRVYIIAIRQTEANAWPLFSRVHSDVYEASLAEFRTFKIRTSRWLCESTNLHLHFHSVHLQVDAVRKLRYIRNGHKK